MAGSNRPMGQILAATVDNCTMVAVIGPASYRLAPSFKQATQAAHLAGSDLIVVDMGACLSMDSTFMGTLAALGFAAEKPDGTPAVLINLTPHSVRLLKGLGVDRILKSYPMDAFPGAGSDLSRLVESLRPVSAGTQAPTELAALMYDAHETLTRADPENIQRFKDVLDLLRREMKGGA